MAIRYYIKRTKMMKLYVLVIGLLVANISWAEGTSWQSLPASSQQTLSQLKDSWDTLPQNKQDKFAQHATQWEKM